MNAASAFEADKYGDTSGGMKSVAIVLLCIAAAIVFGIVHDQVTARVCVEYFTLGHPPLFATEDPTLLGLGWGIVATWWVGLLLGIPLAFVARNGGRPKRTVGSLVRPIGIVLLAMAAASLVAGLVGWQLARTGMVELVGPLAGRIPVARRAPFIADLWAHSASYLAGFVGGAVLIVRVARSRNVSRREKP